MTKTKIWQVCQANFVVFSPEASANIEKQKPDCAVAASKTENSDARLGETAQAILADHPRRTLHSSGFIYASPVGHSTPSSTYHVQYNANVVPAQ